MKRARVSEESGIALISVLVMTLTITLVVTGALSYALRALPQTRDHEDWNAALAAAEAGIDDLVAHLNEDRSYWSRDGSSNEAMTGWKELPGGERGAAYSYYFDATDVARTGALDITSTGRVGQQMRTVKARVRPDGFLEAIYFTDYESTDPYVLTTNSTYRTQMDLGCAVYHPHRNKGAVEFSRLVWDGWLPRRVDGWTGGCGDIRFAPGDVLIGPTRSNDAMLIRPGSVNGTQGPRFLGLVETGWDGRRSDGTRASELWLRDNNSSGEPHFEEGIRTLPNGRLNMHDTPASMAEHADVSGCVYEGPTYVRLDRGRMHVHSPLTPATPDCVGPNLPLKDGGVLYVKRSSKSTPSHPLGMPIDGDVTAYGRTDGDVFVHGVLDGQLTVVAENDVIVVSDLVYADRGTGAGPDRNYLSSDDLLGLIAGDNVSIYHPASSSSADLASQGRNLAPFASDPAGTALPITPQVWRSPELDAAVLALNRSFGVQNYNRGSGFNGSGEALSVTGAIAQKWRGPVATSSSSGTSVSTGYLKDYAYDARLQYISPPYFLAPEDSPWQRGRWAEVPTPDVCAEGQLPYVDSCVPGR